MAARHDGAVAHPAVEQLEALTSLRFFAAMFVLLFHYNLAFPGGLPSPKLVSLGFTGVTFFFILSGFILAHNYCRVDLSDRRNRNRFFAARISRVYPVYVLSLLVSAWFAFGSIRAMPTGSLKTLAEASGILAPLGVQAWVPGAACAINCPTWSISTEFFFYLLFPFVAWRVLRSPGWWLAAALGAWAVITIGFTSAWQAVAPGGSIFADHAGTAAALLAQIIKFFPPGRLPEFVLGIVLYAFWKRHRARINSNWALACFGAVSLLFAFAGTRVPEILMHDGLSALAWGPLIIAAATMQGGVLSSQLATFLGRMSFALYLFHIPVLMVALTLDRRYFGTQLAQHPASAVALVTLMACATASLVHVRFEETLRRPLFRWLSRRWDPTLQPSSGVPYKSAAPRQPAKAQHQS